MAYSFTSDQRYAIDTRDKTLLVSAAAGSGKTATLTERIIASLCDKKRPATLSRLVVATFTRDAAADMKKKIAAALEGALLRDPGNERLLREQLLLSSAEISTISSFCLGLLRRNAAAAELSPSFRILDPAEEVLLSGAALEELIEAVYAGECPEITPGELARLSEHLTSPRSDEGLSALLLSLYNDVLHEPQGVSALDAAARALLADVERPLFDTAFGQEIAARAAGRLSYLSSAILAAAEQTESAVRRHLALFEGEYLSELAVLLEKRDEGALAARLAPLGELPRKGRSDTPVLTDLHKEAIEATEALRSTLAACHGEGLRALLLGIGSMTDILYRLLLLFDARLLAEKRRRACLGFLDIERTVYALLVENGEPTALARQLSEEIDAIYLDEFQDVNALQYGIFRAIAREDNLFMVGDVKQCIYAFRHSDPHIFEALRGLGGSGDGFAPTTVFFRHNFRSDRPIVSYVNRLAGTLLHRLGGYDRAEDDLTFAKVGEAREEPVTTHVFALPTRRGGGGARDELSLAKEQEPAFVAAEIARLLREGRKNDGTPIRPSDILLLFRQRSAMPRFAAAIRAVAPTRLSEEGDLFSDPEVLLALSLLHTVDNPRRDVYLAAALRSPVFAFTLSELVAIRTAQKGAPTLYDALLAYLAEHPDFEKGKCFLTRLEAWRLRAEEERVDELLLTVFSDTGLLALGGEGASARHDALLRFYDYARSFTGAPYRGLSGFISFIGSVMESDARLARPAAEEEEEAVTLLTVHASKGLEAPVVFLCDTGHLFNRQDTSAPLLYDRAYGPVMRLLREDGAAVDNPLYSLVAERIREEQTEEEARLLYVAVTRARERLYVTGSCAKPEEKIEKAEVMAPFMSRARLIRKSSVLSWILDILTVTNDPYLCVHPIEEAHPSAQEGKDTAREVRAPDEQTVARLTEELASRLAFVYPDGALTELPEKLSVSRLSPAVLDGADSEEGETALGAFRASVPRFLSGTHRDEAALRGTATHLFMQFADFDRITPDTVEAELSRLVEAEFLTKEDAARVRLDEIAAFSASPLLARIRAAREVRRELRFHALLDASRFTKSAETAAALKGRRLLVQGVMDCVIEEEDGYTVIDYKTDRLTREELSDRRLAEKRLTDRHGEQLRYYAAACERMYGKPPRELLIYSLALGDTVVVSKENCTE